MAAFKAIKLGNGEYGISNKVNSYIPNLGTYETRSEALFVAEERNVNYYYEKALESWDKMKKLAPKAGHKVTEYGTGIYYKDDDYETTMGDLLA